MVLLHELMGARVLKAPGNTVQESGDIFLGVGASKKPVRRTLHWLQWRNQRLQLFLLYLPGGEHMASEKERDMFKDKGKILLHWDVGLGWVASVNVEK